MKRTPLIMITTSGPERMPPSELNMQQTMLDTPRNVLSPLPIQVTRRRVPTLDWLDKLQIERELALIKHDTTPIQSDSQAGCKAVSGSEDTGESKERSDIASQNQQQQRTADRIFTTINKALNSTYVLGTKSCVPPLGYI